MRIAASGLIILIGVILAINGINYNSAFNYSGIRTDDKAYGGDAYTGIQNAVADVSFNVKELGESFENFFCYLYLFIGLIVFALGVYLFACTLCTYERAPKKDKEDELVTVVRYKDLLDQGVITQEEFDAKKKQLLGL